MGYITLAIRLKRISDKMNHSTRIMYKTLNIDIEPNWYLVLLIIKENPKIAVMEIAQHLRFTHQSVISMTNKMISNGYLLTEKDGIDKRKTVFELTIKARNMLPEIQKIWAHGEQAILELLNENTEIMEHLETLESNLEESSFGERILDKLNR